MERIGFLEAVRQTAGQQQHVLLTDAGIQPGGQTPRGRNVDQLPIGLRGQVYLAVRGGQLKGWNAYQSRVSRQTSRQRGDAKSGAFVQRKFSDDGIHLPPVVAHRIYAYLYIAHGNMRRIEACHRRIPRRPAVVSQAGARQQELPPTVSLAPQVGLGLVDTGLA